MTAENIKHIVCKGNLTLCSEDISRITIMICSVFKGNNKVLIHYN